MCQVIAFRLFPQIWAEPWIRWRYNGRADIENRIKELGAQFGIKRLAARSFWATEAMHHLVITAYNLCVLLQRKLGQLEKCELNTLRWRLFSRAAVWSRQRRVFNSHFSNWPSFR